MKAHPHPHAISGTSDPKPFGGSLSAAMAHESYRPISHLMASTGLSDKLKTDKKLCVADVDAALAKADVPSPRRIELKATLSRLGLLP